MNRCRLRALILSEAGDCFCSALDLSSLGATANEGRLPDTGRGEGGRAGVVRSAPRGAVRDSQDVGGGPRMSDLIYEKRGGIAYLTPNRPERRNAFSPQMMLQLAEA